MEQPIWLTKPAQLRLSGAFGMYGVILEKLYIVYEAERCGQSAIELKNLKLVCLVTLLMVSCVSVGVVNAQTTNEATITSTLSKYNVSPGGSIIVTVTIQNNVATQFTLIRVGMHADFMGQDTNGNDRLLGPTSLESATLGSSPYSVSFIVEVPASTALGTQNYYIGVDAQDSSGQYYSWNSQSSSFQVVAAGNTTPTSGPNNTSDADGNWDLSSTDILMYVAIIAIAAMLILVLLVLLTLRRRHNGGQPKPESKPPPQEPEAEPEPQGEPEGQKPKAKPDLENFDI